MQGPTRIKAKPQKGYPVLLVLAAGDPRSQRFLTIIRLFAGKYFEDGFL